MTTNAIASSLGFLYSTLNADATFTGYLNGIFTGMAPAGTLPDFCTITPMASKSVMTAFGVKVMAEGVYHVKVSGPESDYANIYNAYNQMLTDLQLVRNSGGILACYLEQDIYIQELVSNVPWINLGGLFRIEV